YIQRQPQRQDQNAAFGPGKPLPRFDRRNHPDNHAEGDQHLLRRHGEPPNLATTRTNPFPPAQIMPEPLHEGCQSLVAVPASKIWPHRSNNCAIWLTSLSPRPLMLTITM